MLEGSLSSSVKTNTVFCVSVCLCVLSGEGGREATQAGPNSPSSIPYHCTAECCFAVAALCTLSLVWCANLWSGMLAYL